MAGGVERVLPTRLGLGDTVLVGPPDARRWVRVVGLSVEGGHVVVRAADAPDALRLPAGVPVLVAHPCEHEHLTDDRALEEQMAGWYAGDLHAAGQAVAGHATDPGGGRGQGRGSAPGRQDLVGIYGGDLDHVMDAMGGSPDAAARLLRADAVRRALAAGGHPGPGAASSAATPPASQDADADIEAAERTAGAIG